MVNDYSGSYIAINSRCNNTSRKKKTASNSKNFFSATRLIWKTLATLLFITVVTGIASTAWYGWQIQLALDQIGRDALTNDKLIKEKKLLIVQRDLLQTREHMEKSAQRIGLYPPAKNQVRYP